MIGGHRIIHLVSKNGGCRQADFCKQTPNLPRVTGTQPLFPRERKTREDTLGISGRQQGQSKQLLDPLIDTRITDRLF